MLWGSLSRLERLEYLIMIDRTGRYGGGGLIQAEAGRRSSVAWVHIHQEVEGHFLPTKGEAALREVDKGQQRQDPDEAVNTYVRRYQEAATRAYPQVFELHRECPNCTESAQIAQ